MVRSSVHTVTDDQIVATVQATKGEGMDQDTLAESLEIAERTIRRRVQPLLGKKLWVKPGSGRGQAPLVYIARPAYMGVRTRASKRAKRVSALRARGVSAL